MERYFEQLMDDIYKSYQEIEKNASFHVYPVEVVLQDVPEKYVGLPFYPMKPIYEWMNLDIDLFPPADRWETKHLYRICAALRQLFQEYGYQLEIPWSLYPEDEYPFLLQALQIVETCYAKDEHFDSFLIQVAICEQNPNTCPFKNDCLHNEANSCDFFGDSPMWYKYEE